MPPSLDPLASQPLRRQALHRLMRSITARGLGPEDRLPPERDLAVELQVSRNTVREALKSLEAIGALVRRPKHGSVLKPVDFSIVAEASEALLLRSPTDFADLLVARRTFEISALPLAVENAVEEDFQQMEMANALFASELAVGVAPVEADLAFHQAVLGATHNPFLIQFGALLQQFFHAARSSMFGDAAQNRRVWKEHAGLVRELRAGETEQAQRIVGKHLDAYLRRRRSALPPARSGESAGRRAWPAAPSARREELRRIRKKDRASRG